jgi:hypothetical protein
MSRNKYKSKLERAVESRLDALKRDILIEHDSVFAGNFKQLRENVSAGKVPQERMSSIREWLVMSSLRRNHVSQPEANRLLRA